MTRIQVDLLRHGETLLGTRIRGSTDDPLTERGWTDMRAATAALGDWDGLVTSPLRRCADFAEEIGRERGLRPCTDERLREIHFGDWEGRSYTELMLREPAAVSRFFNDPLGNPPPRAEPLPDFRERVLLALNDLRRGSCGAKPLLVTHGGVIRLLLCHVRGWPMERLLEIDVPHASVHSLFVDAEGEWQELGAMQRPTSRQSVETNH